MVFDLKAARAARKAKRGYKQKGFDTKVTESEFSRKGINKHTGALESGVNTSVYGGTRTTPAQKDWDPNLKGEGWEMNVTSKKVDPMKQRIAETRGFGDKDLSKLTKSEQTGDETRDHVKQLQKTRKEVNQREAIERSGDSDKKKARRLKRQQAKLERERKRDERIYAREQRKKARKTNR